MKKRARNTHYFSVCLILALPALTFGGYPIHERANSSGTKSSIANKNQLGTAFPGVTRTTLKSLAKERVRISGEVTNIRKQQGKWIGRATFTGRTRRGVSYTGSGPVEIRFNKNRTTVNRIVIRFEGKRDGREVSGTLSCYQKITWDGVIGTSFEFSQVYGNAEGNNI